MDFKDAIKTCFSKYATFSGIASRSEFWWWVVFNFLATAFLSVFSEKLSAAFTILAFLPSIAVTSRRLHDTGKSGWAQLVGLIPLIGWLIMLYWLCQSSRPSHHALEL